MPSLIVATLKGAGDNQARRRRRHRRTLCMRALLPPLKPRAAHSRLSIYASSACSFFRWTIERMSMRYLVA